MKKILSIAAVICVIAGTAFAKGYHGDVQVHAGFSSFGLEASMKTPYYDGTAEMLNTFNTANFAVDIQSWNLFDLNDTVSLGFMVGVDGNFGKLTKNTGTVKYNGSTKTNETPTDYLKNNYSVGLIFGPAVSFNIKEIVRLQGSAGMYVLITDSMTCGSSDYTSDIITSGIGAAADIQAKILPQKKISPIVGYRFSCAFTDKIKLNQKRNGSSNEQEMKVDKCAGFGNTFYVGASINW